MALSCTVAPRPRGVLRRSVVRPASGRVGRRPGRCPVGGRLFRGPQPWTADVSGAPASERSAAILTALNDAGGWGNGNVLQIDFAMPVLDRRPGRRPG